MPYITNPNPNRAQNVEEQQLEPAQCSAGAHVRSHIGTEEDSVGRPMAVLMFHSCDLHHAADTGAAHSFLEFY